jgi:hypothetical protein
MNWRAAIAWTLIAITFLIAYSSALWAMLR